jgi:hypothetical protein
VVYTLSANFKLQREKSFHQSIHRLNTAVRKTELADVFGWQWQHWISGQGKYHGDGGGWVLRCLEMVGGVDCVRFFGDVQPYLNLGVALRARLPRNFPLGKLVR